MDEALTIIERKKSRDHTWKMQAPYPGQVFMRLEEPGRPSRIMTYLGLKILRKYRDLDLAAVSA